MKPPPRPLNLKLTVPARRLLEFGQVVFQREVLAVPLIPNLTLLFIFFGRLLVLPQAGPNPSDGESKKLGTLNSFAQKEHQQALRAYPAEWVVGLIPGHSPGRCAEQGH